ncbi:MAG: glycine betaine ABC transporter substrate-binding protein [Acidimicrobiia bacterium]|nr:glycine betaine ABC transporter substrate-binding protein [Acidimicrobiia bacterium]
MLLILAACGGGESSNTLDPDTSAPASTTAGVDTTSGAGGDLSGASFVVGSKEFTEQLILGQITKQVLENAGATVEDQTGLVGSQVVREALVSGEIDMYWEYTGTGWITHLGNTTPVAGSEEQFVAVRDADASSGIVWLDPAPFNNTYAIALASEKATELGLTTVSDLATYAGENPAEATLCGAAEFLGRDDGLPGLEAAYGMTFANVSELELGLVYTSIDQGDPCVFGEVFATDGRIAALDLTVLEDDESFFPSYLPSLNVRQEVFEAYPQLADLFAPVAEALDTATMQRLNAMVDVDGLEPSDVATQFLTEMGLGGS